MFISDVGIDTGILDSIKVDISTDEEDGKRYCDICK